MPYCDDIYEAAADNFGLITSAQAKELGVSDKEMSRIAKDGRLTRIGRGLYRIKHHIPEENDAYAVAVALVGPDAYLYGESVLAMLHLCPTNPNYIYVATPKRVRRALQPGIRVVKRENPEDKTVYDGVPSQTAEAAIGACLKTMSPDRLESAVNEGRAQGYIRASEAEPLMERIRA